jgi:DUF917 family protein
VKTLTKGELEDYITGAVILGCGGGGGAAGGREMVNHAFEVGYKFNLVDINELNDDDMLCVISGVGGGVPQEVRDKVESYSKMFPRTRESRFNRIQKAVEELSKYIGKEFVSYVPSETGGGNGVMPMFLNAMEGKVSIDGDSCGRAKPEIGISLTHAAGIPMAPISIITPFMEVVIVKSAIDDYRGEDITRHIAVASGGGVTAVRSSGTVAEYKRGIAPNQVTRCIKIGAAIRKAQEDDRDPREAFLETSSGVKIFEGKVESYDSEAKGAFNWGNWHIEGTDKFNGHKLRIWYKNENLLSWLDNKSHVTCPDLICIVDSQTCEGLSNFGGAQHAGREITVFGVPAIDRWRTSKAIEILGPRHFGFDQDYVPMEKLI